ncbi:MAG: phosphatase PAP2 family protein [Steroidobacteraceae bacterium]
MESTVFARLDRFEYRLCRKANALAHFVAIRTVFRLVSRLGDGVLWYATMLALPLVYGPAAIATSLRMLVAAALGLALYKYLKNRWVRERPYINSRDIECFKAPLDRYSFPSGHTLHAVSFTTVLLQGYPSLAAFFLPIAIAIALSRPVLGLHYPSDVLAGAGLGFAIALLVLRLPLGF